MRTQNWILCGALLLAVAFALANVRSGRRRDRYGNWWR